MHPTSPRQCTLFSTSTVVFRRRRDVCLYCLFPLSVRARLLAAFDGALPLRISVRLWTFFFSFFTPWCYVEVFLSACSRGAFVSSQCFFFCVCVCLHGKNRWKEGSFWGVARLHNKIVRTTHIHTHTLLDRCGMFS